MSSQEKKYYLDMRFGSRGIFVILCVLCSLMYLAYFLYTLHCIPYAHTLSTHLAMLHTKMKCND